MNILSDPFLIGILILLGIAILAYLVLANQHLFRFNAKEISDDEIYDTTQSDNPLAEIFYLYNHKSEKDWLRWLETQGLEVREEAFKLLAEHLNGPSKFWGYITLEVLGVMFAFKEQKAEEVVGRFIQETGRIWGEYKSLPNYYQKAISALISIHPLYSMRILNEELDRNNSNSQFAQDKKKIIVDALPELEELGIGMMIALLNNSDEVFTIKSHALRVAISFPEEGYRQIILETLKKQVSRLIMANREIRAEDSQLLQDVLKESVRHVGQYDFWKVLKEACSSTKLQPYIINPLVQKLHDEKATLTPTEIYAMTLFQDNEAHDLRKAICKLHALETVEISNICTLPLVKSFDEDSLKFVDVKGSTIFVPSILKSQYDDFKALFFQSRINAEESCEKSYGGVLITGNDKIEKLYFSKAFAKEKNFNFGYINLENIVGKESYNAVCSIFSTLRKPYILFIDNPELMFPLDKSDASTYREKFAQTLYIQALDAKSMLVGSIDQTINSIESEDTLYALGKLKKKFFAQILELNKREERFKPNVIEDYLSFVSSYRLENRSELIHELVELGKEHVFIKFTFFVIESLATMLMVYGKDMPYSEIQKLQSKFIDDAKERTPNDDEIITENASHDNSELTETESESQLETESINEETNAEVGVEAEQES